MASIVIKGDTSGSVTISAPSVAGTQTLNLQAASGTLATTAQASVGTKNLIINGNMQIAQRGTSVASITISGYYTLDRFDIGGTTFGTFTQSQDSDVPTGQGFANSIKFLWTTANASLSANSFLQMHQSIEGQNLQHLKKGTANAESLTVSFWVKSNKTGTYIIRLADVDNTRMICKSYTITVADTWEKKTLTFVGDTVGAFNNDNGRSLDLAFGLCAGTDNSSGTLQTTWGTDTPANRFVGQVNLADAVNNYINITGVQLELGTEATPFEHRMYSTELAMCQRYFSTSYGNNPVGTNTWNGTVAGRNYDTTSRGENVVNIHYPVQMRTLPTLTAYSKAGTSGKLVAGSTSVDASTTEIACSLKGSDTIIRAVTGATIGGTHFYQFHYTADAEL